MCAEKKTTVETHRLCAIFWAIRGAIPVISGDLHVTLLATYLYDLAAQMGVTLPETNVAKPEVLGVGRCKNFLFWRARLPREVRSARFIGLQLQPFIYLVWENGWVTRSYQHTLAFP